MRAHEQREYVPGHANDELDRLIGQSQFFGDLTEHLFRLAGLSDGMRVLDVGCGAGDVAFLAARSVGSSGSVLDRPFAGIGRARSAACGHGESDERHLSDGGCE